MPLSLHQDLQKYILMNCKLIWAELLFLPVRQWAIRFCLKNWHAISKSTSISTSSESSKLLDAKVKVRAWAVNILGPVRNKPGVGDVQPRLVNAIVVNDSSSVNVTLLDRSIVCQLQQVPTLIQWDTSICKTLADLEAMSPVSTAAFPRSTITTLSNLVRHANRMVSQELKFSKSAKP